jgi:NarL family two-component system sensor histidine kinase LiaS
MPKPFRGLRWKLTLRYTVVTVATLLVIELLIIGGVSLILINSNLIPYALVTAVESFIAPQVATYLDQPNPDIESMTEWLESAFAEGLTFRSPENPSMTFHLGDLDENASLTILDTDLIPQTSLPKTNENASRAIPESADQLFTAALSGESDPDRISHISDGVLTTAVPVFDTGGNVLGVVVMTIKYPPPGSLLETLSLFAASLVFFTLAAGLIGTVFGYFTARGLTKRLKMVSTAADSWSQGNFSAFIQDHSGDELGQLAGQLNRMAEQLQNLLQTKQDLATLEERNRLARDLHDSVKQQVFATTMQVGAARQSLERDTDATRGHLDQAEGLARQAQTELASIIHELRPATLRDKGLAQAIEDYVTGWSRLNDIDTDVRIQGVNTLPLEVEQTIYRVTQEALSNVARHSGATHVDVQLVCENGEMTITIADNGKGFDINNAEGKGVGLRSMRERMDALGGGINLESAPSQGTRLSARCQITDQ